MTKPRERLKDILDAIAKIERYDARGQEAFEQEELIQTWILYHIQLIGEAAARLGKAFHESHPEILWRRLSPCGMWSFTSISGWTRKSGGRKRPHRSKMPDRGACETVGGAGLWRVKYCQLAMASC